MVQVIHEKGRNSTLLWHRYRYTVVGDTATPIRGGWIFRVKLHLACTAEIDKLVAPLTSNVTTANVRYNKRYVPLASSSYLVFSLPSVLYTIADPGYDAKKLYEYSKSIDDRSSLSSVVHYEIF